MDTLSAVSNHELRKRLSAAVGAERLACADVIVHLAELDRRKLYLEDACSSLFAYCTERLGALGSGATDFLFDATLQVAIPRLREGRSRLLRRGRTVYFPDCFCSRRT